MSRFGFVGPSYTAGSNAVADEECINFYAETIETPGAQTRWSYFGTPGLKTFAALPQGPTRGQCWTGVRQFTAAGDSLYEVFADGTFVVRMDGTLDEFGGPVSIAFSGIELLVVAGGRAYCYNLAANTFIDVTAKLAGGPIQADYGDGYFIVSFGGSNKFQISAILDGTTWPGIQVNATSVFPENIVSIIVSHRELWVFGSQHAQPYQNTGTDEIYDVIPGALIETGSAATFGPALVDNTVFWVSQDIRGGRQAWRANGYTPQRISTHAVETALSSYSADQIANLVTYSYQDRGHLFWVLYIPNTDCTWVYDVAQSLWHKRAALDSGSSIPDRYEYTNATGEIWFVLGRPLETTVHEVTWNNFAISAGKAMPSDAVIQGIYPVIVANANFNAAVQSLDTAPTIPLPAWQPFAPNPVTPGASFASTEFWNHSLGTDLSVLAGRSFTASLDCSLFLNNLTDHMEVSAVGFAIYYTSATPQTDPAIPPPFPVPAGQGLIWAVPGTVATNQDPLQGFANITSSKVVAGVATCTYEMEFGPLPAVGVGIRTSGLVGGGGALNSTGPFFPITSITGGQTGSFTFATGAADSPLTPEAGFCITSDVDFQNATGAAMGAAATATFIPGTVHIGTETYTPHRSWNHTYAFGKHLVGDWQTGTLYEMGLAVDNHDGTYSFVTDNGAPIRRLRRSPILNDEMEWIYMKQVVFDLATGLGPQPPLLDGDGNPRPPQAAVRISRDRGSTWGNQHTIDCGSAGQYTTRVILRRMGRARYPVLELVVSDPIPWTLVDAYLETA